MPTTLEQSFLDLKEDFGELIFLASSSEELLSSTISDIQKKKVYILPPVFTSTIDELTRLREAYHLWRKEAEDLNKQCQLQGDREQLQSLTEEKERLYLLLRSKQAVLGALITATDWQSPSFLMSTTSMAGRQTGEIVATLNDYKRDQHIDEKDYESRFVKEYVTGWMKSAVNCYVVNSGMAALTTILTFLQTELTDTRPVLLGTSSYFENKMLISGVYRDRVVEVDEMQTASLCQTIQDKEPSVIFLDTLCNTSTIALPDMTSILSFLTKNTKQDTTIVLDNTGLSLFLQPLSFALTKNWHLRLIVFESLNKYHQFGMDRVTGGIIYAFGKDTGKLFIAREHSGTNITDSCVYALPSPNKKQLQQRMLRLGRNALLIASALEKYSASHETPLATVYYPGLANHPAYPWAQKLPFQGSYFSFGFKPKYRSVRFYKQFVKDVIEEAKKRQINIVSGTSFGFNTSRIYVTAIRSDVTEPFVRFSVGTEDMETAEKIAQLLIRVLNK